MTFNFKINYVWLGYKGKGWKIKEGIRWLNSMLAGYSRGFDHIVSIVKYLFSKRLFPRHERVTSLYHCNNSDQIKRSNTFLSLVCNIALEIMI